MGTQRKNINKEESPKEVLASEPENTFFQRVKRGLPVVGRGIKTFFQNYNDRVNTKDMINSGKTERKRAKKSKKKVKNTTVKKETSKENKPSVVNIYINQEPKE